ncbi:hypothetical protein EYF80_051944 [Liparis tanakae]|uniref:Uncharacterized protein n=1 Tax=Liparis tanakae TaxID=230148 RepID=A0A4Z2FBW0_9TELE|nr:hypothetical protein EYF80_051944 [Liparis tanakae]
MSDGADPRPRAPGFNLIQNQWKSNECFRMFIHSDVIRPRTSVTSRPTCSPAAEMAGNPVIP